MAFAVPGEFVCREQAPLRQAITIRVLQSNGRYWVEKSRQENEGTKRSVGARVHRCRCSGGVGNNRGRHVLCYQEEK